MKKEKGARVSGEMSLEEAARNKRHRKSVELTPPTPRPTLRKTSPATDLAIKESLNRCPKEVNINYRFSLNQLVINGTITDRNNLLRTEESFKQSWDIGLPCTMSYTELSSSGFIWGDPSAEAKAKVERYLESAAKNKYFDVPDPKERPDEMYRGFFVIYPEGQEQKDPIFGRKPNLIKVVPLISKLGMAAVEYHNFMTGSDLQFSEIEKANLFFEYRMQTYYITLEATDNLSRKKVTCQSKVACRVDFEEFKNITTDPVPITETYVESFYRVEE